MAATRGRLTAPVVARLPVGTNLDNHEFHTDSPESFFTPAPGLVVVYPSNPYDAKGLMESALASDDPVAFFEPISLYRGLKQDVPVDPYRIPFGRASVLRDGTDVTVVSWGPPVREALKAAETLAAEGVSTEVVDLRTLYPWDRGTVLDSVDRTGRLVVVHEAQTTSGFGAEVLAAVSEHGLYSLEAPPVRVAHMDVFWGPTQLERYSMITADRITAGIPPSPGRLTWRTCPTCLRRPPSPHGSNGRPADMAHAFKLPAVGDTMVEGEIVEWLVGVGDEVDLDQPICSVETDKSVVEMTTPFRGTVLALGGEEGDVIEVGQTLIVVGEPGEEIPAPEPGPAPAAATGVAAIPHQAPTPTSPQPAASDSVKALPKARKLARERGIDLAAVAGTGPGGSITVADVEAAAPAPAGGGRRERLSATRRSIARHMTESVQVPQFTSMVDADARGLLEARAAVSAETGSRVPLDALLVALLVPVLRDHPVTNARLDGDEIEYFDRYDIGVAVDTPEGLKVPVVRGADALPVPKLSAEILRLAAAARDRTVAPGELAGATATVNNVGALGILAGTPLLPVGTSMIAAFGMARPVVRLVGGSPAEVPTITVSATFDHRIIDGGASGRFLAQLKEHVEAAAGLAT